MGTPVVHPTSIVDPTAELADDVHIEPYATIGAGSRIGARTVVGSFASIGPNTQIGEDNHIFHHASVGSDPQDLSYGGEATFLEIGHRNRIREFVTINRGTRKGDGFTRVGSDNMLMACCHVAHDCRIGDRIIMANNALLAGHVTVENGAVINGAAGVQQFSTIGRLAYVGGLTRIVHDVPPFMVVEGHPSKVRKVNTVGLERNGFGEDVIAALREAHRRLFRSRKPRIEILAELEAQDDQPSEVAELCLFLRRVESGHGGRSRHG